MGRSLQRLYVALIELVVGFLASEGIIRRMLEIQELTIIELTGRAIVNTHKINKLNELFHSKRVVTSLLWEKPSKHLFL
jgi:formate dehydrogenase assembly factor FdhD